MGADAALLAAQVARNTAVVLAAEHVALSQAFSISCSERRASAAARTCLQSIRRTVRPVTNDRPLYKELQKLADTIRQGGTTLELL